MITTSEKRRLCEHLRTRYENTPGKVAATSENDLRMASHKSTKIVENLHLDTTRVPNANSYVHGGPEEATPSKKPRRSTTLSENPRTLMEIYGNVASHFCAES